MHTEPLITDPSDRDDSPRHVNIMHKLMIGEKSQ